MEGLGAKIGRSLGQVAYVPTEVGIEHEDPVQVAQFFRRLMLCPKRQLPLIAT
jgi:hypothetical protein